MIYKDLGKTGFKVSKLGFGCMRFPTLNGRTDEIDKEKTIEMLRYAIDNGVNYIDTAYPYHGGKSEGVVSLALKDGYRQKVKIADKLPIWLINKKEQLDKYFNEQLERLDDSFIDFYIMHALDKEGFETLKKHDICRWAEKKKKEGQIGYLGFSFHDDLDTFKKIIDYYDWDFCQIQLNYMDTEYQAGLKGLKYAYDRNIPVIVMEPIRGGNLAAKPEGDIKKTYDESQYTGTPAELALKWVWSQPGVSLLLSGMNNIAQVKENIKVASSFENESLTEVEEKLIENLQKIYEKRIKVNCTDCKYCLPCPQNVNIPDIFKIYNNLSMYNNKKHSIISYGMYQKKHTDASQCIECGRCEERCPQNIEIIRKLKEAEKAILNN